MTSLFLASPSPLKFTNISPLTKRLSICASQKPQSFVSLSASVKTISLSTKRHSLNICAAQQPREILVYPGTSINLKIISPLQKTDAGESSNLPAAEDTFESSNVPKQGVGETSSDVVYLPWMRDMLVKYLGKEFVMSVLTDGLSDPLNEISLFGWVTPALHQFTNNDPHLVRGLNVCVAVANLVVKAGLLMVLNYMSGNKLGSVAAGSSQALGKDPSAAAGSSQALGKDPSAASDGSSNGASGGGSTEGSLVSTDASAEAGDHSTDESVGCSTDGDGSLNGAGDGASCSPSQ